MARSCYDHLAGVAGVALCDALLASGWIAPAGDSTGTRHPGYRVTELGRRELAARGVTLDAGARRPAYACPDWTEPRPHIGGALGAALLAALERAGVARRAADSRLVILSEDVTHWLDRRT
jgi:hypothetical protein